MDVNAPKVASGNRFACAGQNGSFDQILSRRECSCLCSRDFNSLPLEKYFPFLFVLREVGDESAGSRADTVDRSV